MDLTDNNNHSRYVCLTTGRKVNLDHLGVGKFFDFMFSRFVYVSLYDYILYYLKIRQGDFGRRGVVGEGNSSIKRVLFFWMCIMVTTYFTTYKFSRKICKLHVTVMTLARRWPFFSGLKDNNRQDV